MTPRERCPPLPMDRTPRAALEHDGVQTSAYDDWNVRCPLCGCIPVDPLRAVCWRRGAPACTGRLKRLEANFPMTAPTAAVRSDSPTTDLSNAARSSLHTASGPVTIYRLDALTRAGLGDFSRLPFSIKILLEAALRQADGFAITDDHIRLLAGWKPNDTAQFATEVPFKPGRVILQDFTGVPCVVDLAAMRSALARRGDDPRKINPLVPVDLVIDHSVQVDEYGSAAALMLNAAKEFERNRERYEFLRWGQKAFDNFRVVPPATGIVHQVNLEYLASVVALRNGVAFPDSLVGTDSHTTMINGLGVLGWGVGGIEAEAVMLSQPIYMLVPQVIGFRIVGELPEGATATDLVLTVTQMLRRKGVVDKFVEFFGPGLANMSLADRATIANMAPEYGATIGFFPVDDETLHYLRRTARSAETVDLVDRYCKEQGLYRTAQTPDPIFTDTLELDLGSVVPCVAGPKRPQDRVPLNEVRKSFSEALTAPIDKRGFALKTEQLDATATIAPGRWEGTIGHGAVVIAAITSCTNTSNPSVMLASGLVARKAVELGLRTPNHVKTSLAPGSRVVSDYLVEAGLQKYLDQLGFQVVGYGCTTCIGNSGPLPGPVAEAIQAGELVAAAVLSGNRNFEGRVNPHVKANYLASPPLVVAYALAGRVDIDFATEPLGTGEGGRPVYLKDIWPTQAEINEVVNTFVRSEQFARQYATVFDGNEDWNRIGGSNSEDVYGWDASSTYIQEPPYFIELADEPPPIQPIAGARCLVMVGDSVTTDHISPAGDIKAESPAGRFLQEAGVPKVEFNSYGSRRGNDRVMTRGTFANIRVRNLLAPGTEGGVTRYLGSGPCKGDVLSIYDASELYRSSGTPLCVLAGKDYGMGSSRDWAAKGTMLLGVKFVLAESYERIHRANLVGMGVLPLQYMPGQTRESLGLDGEETFSIDGLGDDLKPAAELHVVAVSLSGETRRFAVRCRVDTPVEVEYYRNGGILPTVLRRLASS